MRLLSSSHAVASLRYFAQIQRKMIGSGLLSRKILSRQLRRNKKLSWHPLKSVESLLSFCTYFPALLLNSRLDPGIWKELRDQFYFGLNILNETQNLSFGFFSIFLFVFLSRSKNANSLIVFFFIVWLHMKVF